MGLRLFWIEFEKFFFTLYGSYKSEQKWIFVVRFVLMWFFSKTVLGVFFIETSKVENF